MATTNKPTSWYDLSIIPPQDPRKIIANVTLGGIQGAYVRSQNFIGASAWIPSPFALTGSVVCKSLHTDDLLAVAEAAQWTFLHQGGNFVSSVPVPLRKLLFVRGGPEYENDLQVNLGAGIYGDLQMSFRDNATSVGNFAGAGAGSTPAFIFPSNLTGTVALNITFNKIYGRTILAISARDAVPNNSLFEIECYIVP